MKELVSSTLTVGMLNNNFQQTVKELTVPVTTHSFMPSIKSTTAYRKKFMHEILTMIKITWNTNFEH